MKSEAHANQNTKKEANPMMTQQTLTQLRSLKLSGMADALQEQLTQPSMSAMSFEERMGLLVDREVCSRDDRRRTRLLSLARLKYPQATIEDVDTRRGRGVERGQITSLALGDWIKTGHTVIINGATGCGKTWLACALAQAACRLGFTATYQRLPRLLEDLALAHGDGRFPKRLAALAKTDLLVLDDWGLAPLHPEHRRDLLELLDDRHGQRSTVVTSQLPIDQWHTYLGDSTPADYHSLRRIGVSGYHH